jgi:hypothetical protein
MVGWRLEIGYPASSRHSFEIPEIPTGNPNPKL